MDAYIFKMLTDRLESIDQNVRELVVALKEHSENDAKYWKKIDEQNAQISLLRWLRGGGGFLLFMSWLKTKLGW